VIIELRSHTCQQNSYENSERQSAAIMSERNIFASRKIKLADCLLEYFNFRVDEIDWLKGNQTQLVSKTGENYTLPGEYNEFTWVALCDQKLGREDSTSAVSSRM